MSRMSRPSERQAGSSTLYLIPISLLVSWSCAREFFLVVSSSTRRRGRVLASEGCQYLPPTIAYKANITRLIEIALRLGRFLVAHLRVICQILHFFVAEAVSFP